MANKTKYHPLLKTIAAAERVLTQGNSQKAVSLFTQVIEDPHSSQLEEEVLASCYLNRGFELRKIGRQEDALRDYAKALELNPRSFTPHLNAALIYGQDFGRYQEALVEFDKALELNPTSTEALSSRGLTKMLLDDLEGAEADLQVAISIDPKHEDALCNLGNVYLKRRQPEQAAEFYRRALDASPRDVEIRLGLALALTRMGSQRAAESVLREDKRALRLWRQKGGHVPPSHFIFVKYCCATYAFAMSSAALFMSGSFAAMLIGAIVGAVLGVVLGLLLAGYAKSRPARDWTMVSVPSGRPKVEAKTGAIGAILGVVFGLIGAWIISLFVPPVYPGSYCLGPMFGLGGGGGAVWIAFRELSA